jgi:autotransporter-associated beta strand protein
LSAPVSVAAGSRLTVSNDANTTFSNVLSGAGGIVKSGPGTLSLSNAANTFSGGVTLDAGTIVAAADGSLGAPANKLLLNAGKLTFASSTGTARTFTMSTAATLAPPTGGTLTYASGAVVNGGMLAAGGTHAFADGSALSGATATVDSAITTTGVVSFSNANLRGSVTVNTGTLTIDDSVVSSAGSLTANARKYRTAWPTRRSIPPRT